MDEFAAFKAFIQVVEDGSFSATARRTETSISAISRQVKALEEHLGVRLLYRTTRHQALTDAGRLFFERARGIIHDVERAKREAASFQTSVKGTLKISLRVSAGTEIIVPALPSFLERYPELKLDVNLTDERPDLVANGIDVAVWLGHLGDSSVIARRLSPSRRVVCGSDSYFTRNGRPSRPEELTAHNCIVYTAVDYSNVWHFKKGDERVDVRVGGSVLSGSGPVLVTCAIEGVGLILVQEWMVRDALRRATLTKVLDEWEISPTDHDTALYAVFPHSKGVSPKTRAFLDFLVQLFRSTEIEPAGPLSIGQARDDA